MPKFVPVVDLLEKPLMPTIPSRARRWIRSGKATGFWKRGIFCVRLNVEPSNRNTQIEKIGELITKEGIETKQLRDNLGLKKSKKKLAETFEAHCVDSWVLANCCTGGNSKADNTDILMVIPLRFHRRQLHRLQPQKGGLRPHYGGTISAGFKRGSIVKHSSFGLTYISGYMDKPTKKEPERKVISLHSLETGKRLTQNALSKDIKFLTFNSWRSRYAIWRLSRTFPHGAPRQLGGYLRRSAPPVAETGVYLKGLQGG